MKSTDARQFAKQKKVFTVNQLADWMDCPVSASRRVLKKWGAITSYNANARYYVLPEVADFTDDCIWQCSPASFSSHGNLTNTVVALVRDSTAGLTSGELGAKLGLEPRSFLAPFGKHPQIVREREGRTFVYFCSEPQHLEEQRRRRQPACVLSDHDAVVVLLQWINEPSLSIDELFNAVRTQAPTASVETITEFFDMHGLSIASKKKALRSPR